MISTENMYKQGMRVWIPHPNKVWERAIILEDLDVNQNKLFIRVDNSRETKILDIQSTDELPPLHLSEDNSLDAISNLSSLAVIHEATILHKLGSRFEQRRCYSYCGISTIALNPYFRLFENESDDISNYRNSTLKGLEPHVYGVAEKVYKKLERENRDQTIFFTGESGSGKSFNAERATLYLTTISSKEDQVREKILASSLILQAFGHAGTEINKNSSRFGKFVRMQYDKNYHIIGALLTTYFIDRSHIILQEQHRKAFNIFYYLYAAKQNLSHLQLDEYRFEYLEKKTGFKDDNVHNKKCFNTTIKAFNTLGFSEREQQEILKILAVLIHLQNLEFKKIEGMAFNHNTESCSVADQNQLKILGKILGLDENALKSMRKWMCYKRTFLEQDEILQPMNVDQVIKARDSLVKFVYTKLFNWLVTRMNASFRSPCNVQSFIGILDMHGFENLGPNLFEQFCINYIDEKFEQFFIQSNFKLEQEEYIREEIKWTIIEFPDNMPCVELIDSKCGILDLLEEETKMSSENILPWMENLRTKFEHSKYFEKSTESIANFTIRHFAYPVCYDATDFLAKNYESVAKEQLEVLKESKNELLSKLIVDEFSKTNVSKVRRTSSVKRRASFSSKSNRKTVISELRSSLAILTSTLNKTKPYFVRCIKSNDERKPFTFDSQLVVEQLRAFSIVEATKISAAGYFRQIFYKEFTQRYHCLCQFEDVKCEDKQELCHKILAQCVKNVDVKFGKTKVFLREDTVDHLESLRAEKRRRAAIAIQTTARRFLQQKRYNEIRHLISGIKPYARGYLVRQRIQAVRDGIALEHRAATKIQAHYRGFRQRRWYQYVKHKLPVPEAQAKQVEKHLGHYCSKDMAAIEIQKNVKSFLARRNYERILSNIIIAQSYVRRFLAMMLVKKLKAESNLRSTVLNKSVEQNLDSLQKRIDCLMNMHLSPEDIVSVNSIVDNPCVQTKNRILNYLLFQKIKNLQDLRANQKPCDVTLVEQPQPDTESANENCGINWRLYDKPMVEQYDNEELYRRLFDSFQKVDRDARILQQTAGIEDEEILRLMESYRNSVQATKTAEISVKGTEQKDHSKENGELKEPDQIKVSPLSGPFSFTSQQEPISDSSLDMQDSQELNSHSTLQRFDQQRAEMMFDLDEECKMRFEKKTCRLNILVDQDEPSEDTPTADVNIQDLNLDSSSKANDQRKTLAPLHFDDKCSRQKLRSIMYGNENESFEEISTDDAMLNGMFEFDLKLTESLIHHLTDVGPSIFIEYDVSPDAPAQILMKCIRYADYKNDFLAALSLLHNFIKRVKRIVNDQELFHVGVFWLLNTYSILNYLKQYSKRSKKTHQFDQYHARNTDRQNHQRLQNFDLHDTWVTLEQTCRYLANWIIKDIKSCNMGLHAVTALLHTEIVHDLDSEPKIKGTTRRVDVLLNELTIYYESFVKYAIDRRVISQIFKPIFEYISSVTLSNILSRSDLCSIIKGLHIRCNLRFLERWIIDRQLSPVIQALNPLIQAVRLIQLQPVSQADILNIHENYDMLNCTQILKIVELYNANCFSTMPASYDTMSVSPIIINKLKKKIEGRQDLDDTVLLDEEDHPIQFPFRYSRVKLEEVQIPQRFYLPMLKKK